MNRALLIILDIENDQINSLKDYLPEEINNYFKNNIYDTIILIGQNKFVDFLTSQIMDTFKRSGINIIDKDIKQCLITNKITDLEVMGINAGKTKLSAIFDLVGDVKGFAITRF